MKDAPCNAEEAITRARDYYATGASQYILGTGDYWPHTEAGKAVDTPVTARAGQWGMDCAGFAICWAWKLRRGRRGFNKGPWATVSDDINSDSFLEDAEHKQELSSVVKTPRVGDLLIYPSYRKHGKRLLIGHVGIVESVPAEWDPDNPQYDLLTILQAAGPNKRKPAVLKTTGIVWTNHDKLWSKPQHRTRIVRPHDRP